MRHLERAFDGKNQVWKYIGNVLIAFVGGNIVGGIPLAIVIAVRTAQLGGKVVPNPENSMDLSPYGISTNWGLFLAMLPFVVSFLALVWIVKRSHNRSFSELINGTNEVRWGRVFSGFSVWFALSLLYFLVDYSVYPNTYQYQFDLAQFIPLLIISFALIPLQTTFEELLMRGYLAQGVAVWTKNRWLVVLLPALVFALLHFANPEVKEYGFFTAMSQYLLFGLVFGLIMVLDDGIEISIGAHAANNIFSSLMLTSKSSVLQTSALFNQVEINATKDAVVILLMSILFVFYFAKKYKWDFRVLNKKVSAESDSDSFCKV